MLQSKDTDEKRKEQSQNDDDEEDPVSLVIGKYGRWQLLITFLLSLYNIPCTWHIFVPTFHAAPRDYWCSPPEHLKNIDPSIWKEYSQPKGPCSILDLPWENITMEEINSGAANTTKLIDCTKWTFQDSYINDGIDQASIVSEWNLVCDRATLLSTAEAAFLAGVALGGLVSGILSDRYGRRTTLAIAAILQTIIGISISFVPWFLGYIILRTFLGFVSVSVVFSGFVLSLEVVGGVWRTVSGVSFLFPVSISYAAIAGIAYLIKNRWRILQLTVSLPGILFLLLLWWPITESPRWLLAVGKRKQYYKVLNAAAKMNNRALIEESEEDKRNITGDQNESEEESAGIMDLFKTAHMRKNTLCLFVIWFSVYLVYYGLVLNVGNLGGDLYINSALSGLVEIPALAASILFLVRMGRRWPLCLTLVVGGVACLATLTIDANSSYAWVATAFAMLGKLSVSSSNAVMPVFTAELYPTVIRNLGVGASNVSAGIALMLVPYLWNLASMHVCVPMSVLGVFGLVGGLTVLLLPETGNRPLSETISEEEEVQSHPHNYHHNHTNHNHFAHNHISEQTQIEQENHI